MAIRQISPAELQARRDAGEELLVLDVREDWELELARLPDALHIPMGELPGRLAELPAERPIVVLCHLGGRSAQVTSFLQQKGFTAVCNLTGGIDAWAREADPDTPTY